MSGATSVAPGLNRTQAVSMDSGIHAMHKIHCAGWHGTRLTDR